MDIDQPTSSSQSYEAHKPYSYITLCLQWYGPLSSIHNSYYLTAYKVFFKNTYTNSPYGLESRQNIGKKKKALFQSSSLQLDTLLSS